MGAIELTTHLRKQNKLQQKLITIGHMVRTRDAHFPAGNRETGKRLLGNFPREIGDREIRKNREKNCLFLGPK